MRRIDRTDLAQIDIHSIELPSRGERLMRDTKAPKLGLRLRASGARTWVVIAPNGGTSRRLSLGDARHMPIDTARISADADIVSDVPVPPTNRPFAPDSTVAEMLSRYLAFGARRRWKPSTGRQMEGVGRIYIVPALGKIPVRDITPQTVAGWYKDVVAQTTSARMALSTLSGLMLYAEDHGVRLVGSNPCRGLRKKEKSKRGSHLSPATIRNLWQSLDRLQTAMPDACDAVRLLLLTGARKNEILGLAWDRVAGSRAVLEDSKTGPRTIWLNTPARAILDERRARASGDFVFPLKRADTPLPTIDRQWKVILNEAGIPTLRLHDLRHHFAAVGVSNGIDLKVVGQLLDHHDIDTTLGYAHLATAALSKAASRVSGYIDRSLNGAPARNAWRKGGIDKGDQRSKSCVATSGREANRA